MLVAALALVSVQVPFLDAQRASPASSTPFSEADWLAGDEPQPAPQVPDRTNDHFGVAFGSIGDVDGDGVSDHAVADVNLGARRSGPGRVAIFSGRDGTLLGSLDGAALPGSRSASGASTDTMLAPGSPPAFGKAFAPLGDVDGDGRDDFLVAAWGGALGDGQSRAGSSRPRRRGYVRLYSGKSLAVLRELAAPSELDGFGFALDAADLDGDGIAEWIVGAPLSDLDRSVLPSVHVYSGKDGHLVRTITSTTERGLFGHAVCAIPDVDGDRRMDLAIGAPSEGPVIEYGAPGRVYIVSSVTSAFLHVLTGRPERLDGEAAFGWSLARAGDLDADGSSDLLIGCLDVYVRAWSTRTHGILRDFDDHRRGMFASGASNTVCSLGDLDRDGVPEVAVGCEETYDSGDRYDVTVYSGKLGRTLHVFDTGTSFANVASAGDVDGDGSDDLLVGIWQEDRVVVYSGKTWCAIRELRRPPH